MRTHLAKAMKKRCLAIQAAINVYNASTLQLVPPTCIVVVDTQSKRNERSEVEIHQVRRFTVQYTLEQSRIQSKCFKIHMRALVNFDFNYTLLPKLSLPSINIAGTPPTLKYYQLSLEQHFHGVTTK